MRLFRNTIFTFLTVSVIAILLIIKSNPGIFSKKEKGSFEYVREGEDMLDKNKVKEAITHFEKAHNASPENEAIASNLAYAYSRHASIFEDAKDYDRAIEYFTRAYGVLESASTSQNLAVCYSKRGIAELEREDPVKAAEDFSAARKIASGSKIASRNLSIILFNEAAGRYKKGQDSMAISCLKESLLVNEDPRPLELISDIYYKVGDLDNALFYLDRAVAMEQKDERLKGKLEKLDKEIGLSAARRSFVSEYFEIKYEKDLPVDALAVRQVLKDAYNDIGRDLGYFPSSKTTVFFYSQNNFKNIFKLSDMVRAFYDGNIRMPFPEKGLSGKELVFYIYHEYTHAVISAMTNNNCPVWFSEGVAVMEELRNEKTAPFPVISETNDFSKLSIGLVAAAFSAQNRGDVDMRPYYVLAYTVVRYIVDKHGLGSLRAILRRIADGQHVINAIDDEFLMSEKEFEKRWKEYIQDSSKS